MFITGIITAIDVNSARVKLLVPDMDNFETGWFFVPQMCTVGDKSYNQVKIKTLVGACCSDDLQDGCIIGALYNDEDVCILKDENTKYIFFEDGTKLIYNTLKNELSVDSVGNIFIKAINTSINANTKITGNLNVIGNITATEDIIAKNISLTTHLHGNGNNGAKTTGPQ